MATNEKPLYKNVTISSPGEEAPVISKQYRGISTVANPRGFNLYYNVVLRLLNPDRAAYDFVDLSDDEIDIIRNDS